MHIKTLLGNQQPTWMSKCYDTSVGVCVLRASLKCSVQGLRFIGLSCSSLPLPRPGRPDEFIIHSERKDNNVPHQMEAKGEEKWHINPVMNMQPYHNHREFKDDKYWARLQVSNWAYAYNKTSVYST
jgi:hypothetical protein